MENNPMNTMELHAENAMRVKARHIDSILAREASTSGRLTHKRHAMPIWLDPPFQTFNGAPAPLTRDEETIAAWLASHRPVSVARLVRGRGKRMSSVFPILVPKAREAQEREGAEARQAEYESKLQGAHGAPGGPRRTWLDKLVG